MFNTELYKKAAEKVPQKYLLANLVTMRMRQLMEGADPLVDPEDMTTVDITLKEIAEGLIEPRKEEVIVGEDLFGKD